MFNWFHRPARCPVEPGAKQWIEDSYVWLADELGIRWLQECETILPTDDYFPSRFHPTEECIEELFVRVAQHMGIERDSLRLSFYRDSNPSFAGAVTESTAGLYMESSDQYEIMLEMETCNTALSAVATLAHELGHVILLGEGRLDAGDEDHEYLTDLLTVYTGMGIFTANNVLQDSNWSDGHTSTWAVGRRGYMTMDMFGYALAIYALARNEGNPEWARFLRPDVLKAFRLGTRYLCRTRDCKFSPALAYIV